MPLSESQRQLMMEKKASAYHDPPGAAIEIEQDPEKADEAHYSPEEDVSFLHAAWPPLRVIDENRRIQKRDRKRAHCLYSFLCLGFLAVSIYTLFTSFREENPQWLSEFEIKPIPFPVVTICGSSYTYRTHEFEKFACVFEDYQDALQDDDRLLKVGGCNSELVGVLDKDYLFSETLGESNLIGPCAVFNPISERDSQARQEGNGFVSMSISFDAILSDSSAKAGYYCEFCSEGQAPKEFIMLLSEFDPSTTSPSDHFWKAVPIPHAGANFLSVGLTTHQADDDEFGNWSNDIYTIRGQVSRPWGDDFADSTVSQISIETEEDGVQTLTEQQPSIVVVLGALWGWFGLVGTLFSVCFITHTKFPNYLTRRGDSSEEPEKPDKTKMPSQEQARPKKKSKSSQQKYAFSSLSDSMRGARTVDMAGNVTSSDSS